MRAKRRAKGWHNMARVYGDAFSIPAWLRNDPEIERAVFTLFGVTHGRANGRRIRPLVNVTRIT